jgi:hypothetical protein
VFGASPVNLSRDVHHDRAGFDTDARTQRRLPRICIPSVDLSERPLDRERRPSRALSVVFLRHRIAEQRHQPIAQLFGDVAAHLCHCRRSGIQIRADQIAPVLRIQPAEMLVEPTRSQKITVTCRRSQQLMSALATASVMAGAAGVAADGCVALT